VNAGAQIQVKFLSRCHLPAIVATLLSAPRQFVSNGGIPHARRSTSIRSVVATKHNEANNALINAIARDDLSNALSTRFVY